MLSYLQNFVKNYSDLTELFRPLLKEKHDWFWTHRHDEAMMKIRSMDSWMPALRIFRPGKPLQLHVDVSSHGLGAMLMQDGEPVYFASRHLTSAEMKYPQISRHLTSAEMKYPQIEKELLALVWAFERLDLYTYGHRVTAFTDHKPHVGLKEKPLDHLSTRQQRFMGRLQRYDFDLQYMPGKDLVVADCLSRAPVEAAAELETKKFMDTDLDAHQIFVSALEYSYLSDKLRHRLQEEAANDQEYQNVVRATEMGWTEEDKVRTGEYWGFKSDIFLEDGLLFWRGRPVIPENARPRFLESIHRGHVGINASLKRAQAVWWPQLKSDVKRHRVTCHTCQANTDHQAREPMKSFEIPQAPGLVIASDFFDCGKAEYILFTDLFSGWVEFTRVKTKDTKNLIMTLRAYMMRNGIPRVFHSDRGSAYTSREFEEFCKNMGIARHDASAKHERGNAHAEAAVKQIKKYLNRCNNQDDLVKAILAWHQTEKRPGRPSPAQIHMGRNLRDELHWEVKQEVVAWEDVRNWKNHDNEEAKKYFDRGTKELSSLDEGQEVFVSWDKEWKEGKILSKLDRPRSYKVQLENGETIERNRVKIRPNGTTHTRNPKKPVILDPILPLQERTRAEDRTDDEQPLWLHAEQRARSPGVADVGSHDLQQQRSNEGHRHAEQQLRPDAESEPAEPRTDDPARAESRAESPADGAGEHDRLRHAPGPNQHGTGTMAVPALNNAWKDGLGTDMDQENRRMEESSTHGLQSGELHQDDDRPHRKKKRVIRLIEEC